MDGDGYNEAAEVRGSSDNGRIFPHALLIPTRSVARKVFIAWRETHANPAYPYEPARCDTQPSPIFGHPDPCAA